MTITFYDASVPTYVQTLDAVSGVLAKGLAHFKDTGSDPDAVLGARLADDMLPFAFQLHSVIHHSVNALAGIKSGVFKPPTQLPEQSYVQWQIAIGEAASSMKALTPDEVNAIGGNDLKFELGRMTLPFTATGFLFSFSFPNFYFHAATTYDILRSKGVPLGKRDFMGALRMKQ
jgi:hypothetical protein